jgi:hypothetical protein
MSSKYAYELRKFQQEIEELQEIEKVSIEKKWKYLSDFVDKNFYK